MLMELWSQAGLQGKGRYVCSALCHRPSLVSFRLQLRQCMTSCPPRPPSPAPYKTSVLHGNCAEVNNLLTSGRAWPRPMMLSER